MRRTSVQQSQVGKSQEVADTLPLGYSNITTLEDDLNYLRSVITDLKGTVSFDSPLLKNLEQLANDMANISFEDVHLSGESTSETPPIPDSSNRIATTKFVTDVMAASGGDSRYTHHQSVAAAVWGIDHPLLKHPTVTVVDSSGATVEGNVVYDAGNLSRVEVYFTHPISGRAYLN